MLKVGQYNTLRVIKEVDFGMYLDGGSDEILLPKRYVPAGLKIDDEIEVFVYYDNEQRLIATTDKPYGVVGEIVYMEVSDLSPHGAFLKWGIMKDLFVPISQQSIRMKVGDFRFVKIFIDEQTGRVAATEKIDKYISNADLTVTELDPVTILIYKKTDIGYKSIINNKHLGLLHFSDVFQDLEIGNKVNGFIKHIRPDNKLDLALGTRGYTKVVDNESKIISLLQHNADYLPYNDKSNPEEIYSYFGMSKKTFKMVLGALYKKKKIEFTQTGIKLID